MASDPKVVRVNNVRLSFPALFKPTSFEEGKEKKFGMTAILDKKVNAKDIEALKTAMRFALKEQWGDNPPKGIKLGLRDGSEKDDVDGYGPDVVFFAARSAKRVPVVDTDKTPLTEEDNVFYAGCYVNALVRVWAQDNNYGKRINFALQAVQFVRDGEAFGEGVVNVDEAFDDVSGQEGNTPDANSIL